MEGANDMDETGPDSARQGAAGGGAPDAGATATRAEWFARIEEIGEEAGYFQPIGARHCALFVDDGPVLLVAFDSVEAIRSAGGSQMPPGYGLARAEGWSYLGLIADGETWFRDPAVWAWFDRQLDDGFFEDFDRVVFYGADMGGYAAAAFSVCAPGATVLAVRPQATLLPERAEWDGRYPRGRRLDFTSRYGYAPDMTEAAAAVYLLYDPDRAQDAMHASLFLRPHVVRLRCRNMGGRLETSLARMGVLDALIRAAVAGRLDRAEVCQIYRAARREHLPYVLRVLSKLATRQRHGLAARLAGWALHRQDHPRLREAQATAERMRRPEG
jgi:hypothetical protein